MLQENLLEIGFTKNETKIYFAILELGESKAGEIQKKAEINTGRFYDIANSLIKKGVISYIIKNNTKLFYATDPTRLIDYIEERKSILNEKEKTIKKILPELIKKNQTLQKTYRTEIFQGIKGIKSAIEIISKEHNKDNLFYIMGAPKIKDEGLRLYFTQWHNTRVSKKAKLKIIYNEEAIEKAKERKKLPFTQVKIMQKGIVTPAWICIINDYVLTVILEGEVACILTKNQEIANSYIEFFNMIWAMSK